MNAIPRPDALDGFHPAVATWFRRAFPLGATPTQAQAWARARGGDDVLVSAPTGSGKTLAAFLAALDELVVRGERAPLPDSVQVLYVSPLKALSNDIEKNLQAPLNGIRDALFEQGRADVGIRTAVRTGDTSASERTLMRKLPPHVLVTTPESLFILLTSASGRAMLGDVRTVIVDELHALAGSKRGAHLMLSLERLSALCAARPARIGLSATVKPIEAVAEYLSGTRDPGPGTRGRAVEPRGVALESSLSPAASACDGAITGTRDPGPGTRERAVEPHGVALESSLSPAASACDGAITGTRDPGPGTRGRAVEPRGVALESSLSPAASACDGAITGSRGRAVESHGVALESSLSPAASACDGAITGTRDPGPGTRGRAVEPRGVALESSLSPAASACDGAITGSRVPGPGSRIVDAGHVRARDLALELPRSALDAVMSHEVWAEVYDRLAELSAAHRTTLIFVNQRRIAERVARHLAERLGEAHVTAHHGSLAKEHRFQAEQRLKAGQLKALVATSSLELGIDIGDVDLVCQLGSPRWISAFLQRVGRAGHAVGAVSKGRLFPLTLDDLAESVALLDAVQRGELDRNRDIGAPLDVLAQQILAEVGCGEWDENALFEMVRRAAPYRDLPRARFDAVVAMLAEGYATRRGRRGAWLHHDAVNGRLRSRRGAALTAVTNAGVIPDQFDSDVILLPEGQRIGSLNEDFAFESIPGDIFQLGNTAYRIAKIETGKVLVEDANGQPPTLPFWLGESLGRSDELSLAVSRLFAGMQARLRAGDEVDPVVAGVPALAWRQLRAYLGAALAALGSLPTRDSIVFERFFDEVGDAHLVIHSPFGSRINKAWGLALRKRFCRTFNFELQASALEDSIILSLGPTHSFPLDEVARYLHPASARDVLVQALLDVPMFPTRFRWAASIALAIRRMNGGKRVPPQFQRSDAEDLLTVVFPDQVACIENLSGPREIPEHPLVAQSLHDCLHDTMDVEGFLRLIAGIVEGRIQVVCADLTAPSPLAGAILNARPYAFLDDGEAEERRTRAVNQPKLHEIGNGEMLARLDPAVIAQVREEAWPLVRDADELHDALMVHGFLATDEVERLGARWRDALLEAGRAVVATTDGGDCLVATERSAAFAAAVPQARLVLPAFAADRRIDAPDAALAELIRGRLELLGPTTAAALAAPLGVSPRVVEAALAHLEGEGTAMRGRFDPALDGEQWCDRRLLARIHRLCRQQRRARVQAVPPAQFMRFLLRWQGVGVAGDDDPRRQGESGLLAVIEQLEGWVAPAIAWERDLLPARMRDYQPGFLDRLCGSGQVAWWRPLSGDANRSGRGATPIRSTPILLAPRSGLPHWRALAGATAGDEPELSGKARRVADALRSQGALFLDDLQQASGLIESELESALAELVAAGRVACDSFAGLRTLIAPSAVRERLRRRGRPMDVDRAGRWALVPPPRTAVAPAADAGALADPSVEHVARVLLRRYGVVFRAALARETHLPPWRELHYVYRRMEAREEVLGGRFVEGFAGEQFALPEAAAALRHVGDETGQHAVSAADPLNLLGILVGEGKVAATARNRVLLADGVPVATLAGSQLRSLRQADPATTWSWHNALLRRSA